MPVPITGLVVLAVVYVIFALYALMSPPDEKRGWPWLLRVSAGYIPFAALVTIAMYTGRNLDEGNRIVRLLFGIGLGPFVICPVLGATAAWLIWQIQPLRVGSEELWMFVFRKERERFGFNLPMFLIVGAVLGFVFSFVAGMNINFQWGEDYYPGDFYP